LEQFLHAFTSRGFDSVSWAFLLIVHYKLQNLQCVNDELARCHQSFSNDVVLRNSVASCIAKRWSCKNYLFFS